MGKGTGRDGGEGVMGGGVRGTNGAKVLFVPTLRNLKNQKVGPERERLLEAAIEQIWHIQDSQGPILASALTKKSFERFKWLPLRSEAESDPLVTADTVRPHKFNKDSLS